MLKISLKPSRRLAATLVVVHLAAAAAIFAVEIRIVLKVAVALMIAASCAAYLYGPVLLRNAEAIVELEIGEGAALSFQTRRGEWREGALLGSSFVAPYLTVLNIAVPERWLARHVVILPDGIDAEEFRRLRVWLRWRVGTESN